MQILPGNSLNAMRTALGMDVLPVADQLCDDVFTFAARADWTGLAADDRLKFVSSGLSHFFGCFHFDDIQVQH